MNETKVVFDVILPTHNRSHTLERAINSVLNQTYQEFKLWVVDDGSTDGTAELLQKYHLEKKMMVIKQENLGVSAARNRGIIHSTANWLAFLDSDDEWLPKKLEAQALYIQKKAGTLLLHSEEVWIRNGVRVNPMQKYKKIGGDIYERCLKLCLISPSTVVINRALLNSIGMFNETYPVCEDYDLWLRITSKYNVDFIPDALVLKYGGHEDQLSLRFKAMDYWRVKSMKAMLERHDLDESKKILTAQELIFKSNILLLGYKKYQHWDKISEVESMIEFTEDFLKERERQA